MLTLESCIKTLNKNGKKKYTREEAKAIREYLYLIARLEINNNLNEEENENINLL